MKILIILALLTFALTAPAQDEVKELKGYYDFSKQFKMYSGYLTIQESPLIKVHYLFVTSKNKPQTDDVVMWSNGGPGCSSLIGPQILFQGNTKLSPDSNPHSWNNNANMLFLETPPGVGFSLNEDKSYEYNDTRSAQDNMAAIKQWFKLFPQYQNNNFWISGESYCGMYIPLVTDLILKNKDKILPSGKQLNFKGIMIGNGVMLTQLHWRRQARNTFYSRHYHIGPEIQALISQCNYNSSDDNNFICKMGNKLVDQVYLKLFSKLKELILTTLLVSAMLVSYKVRKNDVFGIVPLIKKCINKLVKILHAVPMMMVPIFTLMTKLFNNNYMLKK